jgi:peptidoglycan-associated lipoprotein
MHTHLKSVTTALLISALFSVASCAKKQQEDELTTPTTDVSTETTELGDSDSGKAMGLQTVQFPYDSFTLNEEARATIKNNASILKDKASLKVQIEGHCDSRGGIQYNIALGEKRANAVRKFMEEQGVPADRLTTISYGKERLLDSSDSEAAHGKNRRANFVITSK